MKANNRQKFSMRIQVHQPIIVQIDDMQAVLEEYRERWVNDVSGEKAHEHEVSLIDVVLIAEDLDLIVDIHEFDSTDWHDATEME